MKRRDFNKNLIGLATFFGLVSTTPMEEKKVCRHGIRHDNFDIITPEANEVSRETIVETYNGTDYFIIENNGKQVRLKAKDISINTETERLEVTTIESLCPEYIDGSKRATITFKTLIKEYHPFVIEPGLFISCQWEDKSNHEYECNGFINSVGLVYGEYIELEIAISGAITIKPNDESFISRVEIRGEDIRKLLYPKI